MKLKYVPLCLMLVMFYNAFPQSPLFTKEDTLLGSNTPYRSWWDVQHYTISVTPDYKQRAISGDAVMAYKVGAIPSAFVLQVDLQEPLMVDSIFFDKIKQSTYEKVKNRYMLSLPAQQQGSEHEVQVYYHGKPKVAANPPWDGGWVWKKDSLGNPWMSVACQGAGASVWFPCKDIQEDEPDKGARLTVNVPDTLTAVANGKLISRKTKGGLSSYTWEVTTTINAYNIIPYIGKYTELKDSVMGEKGSLLTDYWVLNYHVQKAIRHLKPSVQKTLKCLEYWYGPYPFYEDSYKIVEAPYLGMEHQSNVAYGNYYLNGYLGSDLSRTGWGLKWDFIVVHETAHEWFGNSVTATDVADNWIHEGFASYAEVLFTECEFGKEAGRDYCEGIKKSIDNDIPVIGKYGVRKEGSGDIYNKGSNVIQMIRQWMNNDEQFRMLIRDISATYYHKIISTQDLEAFIAARTKLDLSAFFEQYLRTTKIPVLEYKLEKGKWSYRYTNCVQGFAMPVNVTADHAILITPGAEWQSLPLSKNLASISIDRNVYVQLKKVK